jgi:hypothetical protein
MCSIIHSSRYDVKGINIANLPGISGIYRQGYEEILFSIELIATNSTGPQVYCDQQRVSCCIFKDQTR